MRLFTWNVNSVNARLERLLAFLDREKPDVLCLQELKCTDDKFPWDAVFAAGYRAAVHGQRTYNGVAVLARTEPENVTLGFDDDGDDTASRCLGATIDGLRVYSVYVPNGQAVGTEKYAYKLEWLRRFGEFLRRRHRPDEPLVVAGDFNVAPDDRDVYDPEAWREKILCSTLERQALAGICEFGLQDSFRKFVKEGGHYSWWDYRMLAFPKNLGLRIDLVLATAPVIERCTAASIARDERKGQLPSDHAPVAVVLQ